MKRLFSPLTKRRRASRANARGRELQARGDQRGAIARYLEAAALDPDWDAPLYNLGLIYKHAAQWQAAFDANLRATELGPDDQANWWNLGIAATALGRWSEARRAWRGAGIAVPDGEGPVDWPCGYHPIRLNPSSEGETVWSQRIDPARARLSNIPLAGFCFGDVVLHDGAANGYRQLDGREVPVFDCLALLEPSQLSTWCVEIELAPSEACDAAFGELEGLAEARGFAAEDWTRSIRRLCKACSEGRPHEQHAPAKLGKGPHRIAIAAHTRGEVNDLLDDWRPGRFGARLGDVAIAFSHT